MAKTITIPSISELPKELKAGHRRREKIIMKQVREGRRVIAKFRKTHNSKHNSKHG